MQSLHAAIHDFRKAGVRGDVDDWNAGLFEKLASSSGGQNLKTEFRQAFHKGLKSGLVADADQCSFGHGIERILQRDRDVGWEFEISNFRFEIWTSSVSC